MEILSISRECIAATTKSGEETLIPTDKCIVEVLYNNKRIKIYDVYYTDSIYDIKRIVIDILNPQ